MKHVLAYLEQLGLSIVEGNIYLTLLASGPMTVAQLAKTVGINRTAAYPYISSLLEKGLMAESLHGARKQIIATDPERLQDLIEKKLESVKTMQAKFPTMLQTLQATYTTKIDQDKRNVRYYKGRNGIKAIHEEALRANELRCYANLSALTFILPHERNLFDKALSQNKKITIREIVADEPNEIKQFNLKETSKDERYRYKCIPREVGLTAANILMYDNNVAIITAKKELEGFIFSNLDYYTNSIKLFDFIWSVLPEPIHTK